MVLQRPLFALLLTAGLLLAGNVQSTQIEHQRQRFLEAEKALERGDRRQFHRLKDSLRDYPLHAYLEYQELLKDLDKTRASDVSRFLKRHRDKPLASMLRARWLNQLAERKDWPVYLEFYQPSSNISRRCHQLTALIDTGQAKKAMPQVADIWLYGKSRPSACDPVFKAWSEAGYRTTDITWQRIEKAMLAGQWRLAEYLGKPLSDKDQVWLKRWVRLHRNPREAHDHHRYRAAHPYREAMLAQATRRLARWDGLEAVRLWQALKPRYAFSIEQVRDVEQYILRNLERTPGDEAYAFVRSVVVAPDDMAAHEARIRAALLREDWSQLLRWIADLPADQREEDRWTYWLARGLEGTGNAAAAEPLYRKAAEQRSYYGFLAADRIDSAYHLAHSETPVCAKAEQFVSELGAVQRARELFGLKRWSAARREWRSATRNMDPTQLKAAARLAKQHGWHDRAIFTLARTNHWDDLELRFPLEHAELVEQNARLHGIDIAWIFAVMRQESAFMHNARSHAGAMGLMQLMPATARNVSRQFLKRKPPRRSDLFKPDTNIALGTAYLKQMKGELGDSAILATAAYNAGPHRVTRWLPERTLPADIWIELVPFKETRGYLRRVLAYTVIYEKRMGRTPKRLNDRLHPVPPSISLISSSGKSTVSDAAAS